MISIIIPAHNEAAVIERCLRLLSEGAPANELQIIVVCNGCRDRTADLARAFGGAVQVIETEIPSKSNALNLGDAAARHFPRIYTDADVLISYSSIKALSDALESRSDALAAAPAVDTIFPPGTAFLVRAYYAFWMELPYVKEGMMAAGVYAVSEAGRKRFDRFPDLISDDGFFRLQFTSRERIEVAGAVSSVLAPTTLWNLILIKTRSRLGLYQVRARYPELFNRELKSKNYGRALATVAIRPHLWFCAIPYLAVNLVSRYRAKRQLATAKQYVWERDESTRTSKVTEQVV